MGHLGIDIWGGMYVVSRVKSVWKYFYVYLCLFFRMEFFFRRALNFKWQLIYCTCHLQNIVVGNCINWPICVQKRQQSVSGIHGLHGEAKWQS